MLNPMQAIQMIGMLRNSGNPQTMLQQMAQSDPKMQQALNMAQSGNPKEVFLNLANESGMSKEQIEGMIESLGVKM